MYPAFIHSGPGARRGGRCIRAAQGFAPRGFAAQGFCPPQGFAAPGFRPGLWSTGPTARPGTGERPVGAPDHSQGRNPWAANPWAARIRQTPRQTPRDPAQLAQTSRQTPRDPARLAQTPRQTPRDLRGLRKRHGKCRETCAACANATANAARLARLAQTPRQMPRDLRGLRKRHGKPTGRKAPTTSTGPQGPNNINRAARPQHLNNSTGALAPPTLSELWTQERITRTCSSSCCSS